MLFKETVAVYWARERERKRKWVGGGSERHYNSGGGEKHYFLFEGSQALPASPSDRGEAWVQGKFNMYIYIYIYLMLLKLEGLL
jgi:hypothetical protein